MINSLAHIAFDEMDHFVGLLDSNGILQEINRASLTNAGVKKSEVIGKYFPDTVWCSVSSKTKENMKRAIETAAGGEAVRYEIEDYGRFLVDFLLKPIKDTQGNVIFMLAEAHDITSDRIREREVASRFRSLTDTIPQLMCTVTPNGKVNYANERCLRLTGTNSTRSFNKQWMGKIHPDDVAEIYSAWNRGTTIGKKIELEYRMLNHDGSYRWFLGRALPIKNEKNEILYWIGTGTDIDDQKKVLAELEVAKELAEKANATKSAFLANMSHEIRTPLAAILGYSDLLKDPDLPESEREQYINTINRNGKSLTRIIDDILDLAKVEAGRLEVEEINFSLPDLMLEVVDLFKEKAKMKGISLKLNIEERVPAFISTDPTRLRQILINIIGNAVKFTSVNGVFVDVKLKQNIEGALRIDVFVKDTGPGLSQEQRSRLFKPFSQGDNTMTRQFGGTGLGLVLSQRLSQALGGSIHIEECSPGKGSTFVISFVATVPKNLSQPQLPLRETAELNSKLLPLKDIRVLLVDDSLDNQYLVNRLLSKNGAWVELAGDGSQAIEKALTSHHDIVLMDIQMPIMDGYRAIQILNEENYNRPVIALTAHAMLEDQLKTKAAGFSGHLTKPIDVNELVEAIRFQTQKMDFRS